MLRTAAFLLVAVWSAATLSAPTSIDARYARLARGINLTRWFQYSGLVPITVADRDMLKKVTVLHRAVRIPVAPQYLLSKCGIRSFAARVTWRNSIRE